MTPKQMLDIFKTNIVVMRGTPTSDVGGGPDYLKITPKANATGEVRRGNQSIACNVM